MDFATAHESHNSLPLLILYFTLACGLKALRSEPHVSQALGKVQNKMPRMSPDRAGDLELPYESKPSTD